MKKRVMAIVTICVLVCNSDVRSVEMDWVTIGDAGNPSDDTGYGRVGYEYQINKFEVTGTQYAEFLNAVAVSEDTYQLWVPEMGNQFENHSGHRQGGVQRSGSPGEYYYYSVGTRQNSPINYVSFHSALRFVNWLHNGQPTGVLQTPASTEDGAYTFSGSSSVGPRNPDARVFLPSEDEWYKAAYFDPSHGGPGIGAYWDYPTRSDIVPTGDQPPGNSNSANFYGTNGHAVTQQTTFSGKIDYLTSVGAYSLAESAYGTFDQGGNVWEWNEAVIGSYHGLRGGAWGYLSNTLYASFRYDPDIMGETVPGAYVGFRVATIPEPATLSLFALGIMGLRRKRR